MFLLFLIFVVPMTAPQPESFGSALILAVMLAMMAAVTAVFGSVLLSCRSAGHEPLSRKSSSDLLWTAVQILLLIGMFVLALETLSPPANDQSGSSASPAAQQTSLLRLPDRT